MDQGRERGLGGVAAHLGLRRQPDADRWPFGPAEQRAPGVLGEVRTPDARGFAVGQRRGRRDRRRDTARAAARPAWDRHDRSLADEVGAVRPDREPLLPELDIVPAPELEAGVADDADRLEAERPVQPDARLVR